MRKLRMDELGRKSVEEFKRSPKIPVVVVLENVRSAYNVGSAFRTADAFLIESIFLVGYTANPPHKEIKKTALGAEDTVNWKHFTNAALAIDELKQDGYKVFAIEQVANSISLEKTNFRDKMAVVFGNEVSGIEQPTVALCDGYIEIPQFGMKHSLNIATAVGVVLWEMVRTRISGIERI